jgi:lipoate-protein ligase B
VTTSAAPLRVLDLLGDGPIGYADAWERQKELVALRQEDAIPDTLLLLTHPPTVTYGRAADVAANLLLPPGEYAARGVELVATDRGGDVTYHGPGQLVGYPIVKLEEGRRDLHRYVRTLEEALIRACRALGAPQAGRADWHAGVWAGDGYLAALGVKVSRWVTHHGFALNVTEEVRAGFDLIVPCGVAGKRIVTVSELAGRPVSVAEAARAVAAVFPGALADVLAAS